MPWPLVLEPAIRLANEGVELTRSQAYLHAILDLILRHTEEGRRIYGPGGLRLNVGERLVLDDLGGTLELLAKHGSLPLYRGQLGRKLVRHLRETGGVIGSDDLAAYRVVWRRPGGGRHRGPQPVSNTAPSSGGVLLRCGPSVPHAT